MRKLFLLFVILSALCVRPVGVCAQASSQSDVPGFDLSLGRGLQLNIDSGVALCGTTPTPFVGGSVVLSNNTVNYVYLDTTNNCTPAINFTGFSSTTIPLAQVKVSNGVVVSLQDLRARLSSSASGGLFLQIANNLSDLNNAATALSNLGAQPLLTNPVTGPGSGATVGHMAGCNNAACTAIVDIGAVPTLAILGGAPIASPTFTGKASTAASSTGSSGFNLTPGIAPTSPANGDMWDTGAGLYIQINGATVGPLAGGGSMTWPSAAGIAVYAGASAWGSSLTAPTGALVGAGQANAYTTGLQDFSSATVKLPASVTVGANSITLPTSAGTLALVSQLQASITGIRYGNGGSADTAATAAQLGTLADLAQYSVVYSNGTSAALLGLAGNTATQPSFLASVGTGSAAQAPSYVSSTGSGSVVLATSPSLTTPTLGVATATTVNKITITAPATSATLTLVQGSTLATAGAFSTTLTATATTNATLPAGTVNLTQTVASGSLALATSAITSYTCQAVTAGSVNSATATNVVSTDTIKYTPNGSIKAVTGFVPAAAGGLTITGYPTAGNVNFDVCNWTASSITPGAVTLNWEVTR